MTYAPPDPDYMAESVQVGRPELEPCELCGRQKDSRGQPIRHRELAKVPSILPGGNPREMWVCQECVGRLAAYRPRAPSGESVLNQPAG